MRRFAPGKSDADGKGEEKPGVVLAYFIIALAIVSAACSVALTVRSFVRCPYSDMWEPIDDLALGRGPWDLRWLWSQHNEHRIAITRLLIFFDWKLFGGYGVSLLVITYLSQAAQLAAVAHAIERWTDYPTSLKRILQGLFAVSLFHPLQSENFVLPFQVSFVIPFALATLTFVVVSFSESIRPRGLVLWTAALAPVAAALNLAAGLLIWPVALTVAGLKRMPVYFRLIVFGAFSIFLVAYLIGYQTPSNHSSPSESIRHPLAVLGYAAAYLESPFTLRARMPAVTFLSFGCLLWILVSAGRRSERVSDFEIFCLAECGLVMGAAVLTGLGRLRIGPDFALMSRYHTPVLIYWASFTALVATRLLRSGSTRAAGWTAAAPAVVWTCMIPLVWGQTVRFSDPRLRACQVILRDPHDQRAAKVLDPAHPGAVAVGAELLQRASLRSH